MTLTISRLPPGLNPGYHLLTVITAGVRSEPKIVEVICSVAITQHPSDQTTVIGSTAVFTAEIQGARRLQWQRDGIDIPGATGQSYTTPPVNAADVGTTYRLRAETDCQAEPALSTPATLNVEDTNPPTANVLSPSGGEYWLLSDPDGPVNTEIVTWDMSDNIRICRVEASLVYSEDGITYHEAPAGGGLPATFGDGGVCRHPGVDTTGLEYTLPFEPPSGTETARYKIRLRVTDQAGNTTVVESARPFTIAKPNPDAVETLIVANVPRMQALMAFSEEDAATLDASLRDLAEHPDVRGLIAPLDAVTHLGVVYADWDAGLIDANDVLFGAGGIHDYLLDLVAAFPGVRYVIVVGDDRIIPMARVPDHTAPWSEEDYIQGSDLTAGTTVGRALAADNYLSDDLLALLSPIRPEDVDAAVYLPDLALGRLVETPAEIIQAITVFLNYNGILDLTALDPVTDHKVLVTGYDFLMDSGKEIRRRWKNGFGLPEPHDDGAFAPVNGQLISGTWGEDTVEDRRIALLTRLSGNGGERYGVMSLNGHATHYEEGVPGVDAFDIQGLNAAEIYSFDLAGSIVYAVGCHAGLPVPDGDPADHPLDLPQTMLARGVMAYVANSGYGWGLRHGIGLSERMVEILTEEMTRGGTVVVGDAVRESKLRYFLESPRFDDYDAKTSMQWTFYGFPMYAVKTGIAMDSTAPQFSGWAPTADERPAVERLGRVTVERHLAVGAADLPDYLSRLELYFDFTVAGVYVKHTAAGDKVADGTVGCPPDAPDGCYYKLNGLATGESDLPIEPYFVYDSRLSGTSQHGVLWLGGAYDQESGWLPVIGELVSNGGYFSDSWLPRAIYRPPGTPGRRILGDEDGCRPTDLDLSSMVVDTGELAKADDGDPEYTIHRLYREIDLEVFYFNNTADATGNCDRTGPLFGAGPHHQVTGSTIEWSVPAVDAGGVWRVVVVYNDETQGRWLPLDLVDDGTGTWRGSLRVTGTARLTYFLQAVDLRGNVAWLEYEPEVPPASGLPLGLPQPIEVLIVPGQADVTVTKTAAPDPVLAGDPLSYNITVSNLGPDPADGIVVTDLLPAGVSLRLSGGSGWSCGHSGGTVTCTCDTLAVGTAPAITILVTAPTAGGWITNTVTVTADNDPYHDNDVATIDSLVIDETMTDLAVVKEDGGVVALPGETITYSITVTNHGPNAVVGAVVSDDFPSELEGVVWGCLPTVGSWCTEEGTGDISDTVNVLPQGTLLYMAMAVVAGDAAGPIVNTASVSVPAARWDYAPANNTSTVVTAVVLFADGFESGDFSAWSVVSGSDR